ncbi:MAG: hypothetical protein ABI647_04645 [Gemmatimonadota bacterium]
MLLVVATSVSLQLGEVVVRIAAPQHLIVAQPGLFEPVDSVGWIFRPNISLPVSTGERVVEVHTDRERFRTGRAGRREGAREVLLLGDSFLAALQVEHEQSVTGLLEQALGDSVAFRNAGVPGWGPSQYLIRARGLLRAGRFGAVAVFVYIGNDIDAKRRQYYPPHAIDQRARLRIPARLAWKRIVNAIVLPLNDWLKEHSHAFVLIKNRTLVLRMKLGLAPTYFPQDFLRTASGSERWSTTAAILNDIDRLGWEDARPTVFVLIPAAFQTEPTVFAAYMRGLRIDSSTVDLDQPTNRLSAALRADGLCVIDALPAFRDEAARGRRMFGSVDRHLSPDGNVVLARMVAPALRAALGTRDARAACAAVGVVTTPQNPEPIGRNGTHGRQRTRRH